MKITQFQLHETTHVDINTGLKATALTTILDLHSIRGRLLAIYCTDPDDLTQNERIGIVVDDEVLLDDAAYDIPNTDDFIHLLASIAKQSVLSGTGIPTDSGSLLDDKGGIPFNYRLQINYLRAVAGTTGLTINIVYTTEPDIKSG